MKSPPKALLLLGPTGSGKSPLGDALAKQGISSQKAAHFDFGAHLRNAVAHPEDYPLLTPDDITLLTEKLMKNALLEDHEFYLAENIIRSFITNNYLKSDDVLIVNGLPRHVGQAQAINRIVKIETVVYLSCSPEVVLQRISMNTGGDRTERTDDSNREIERKLKTFEERTLPLIDYYKKQEIDIQTIIVTSTMTPEDIIRRL
jgi:adenylate kinase